MDCKPQSFPGFNGDFPQFGAVRICRTCVFCFWPIKESILAPPCPVDKLVRYNKIPRLDMWLQASCSSGRYYYFTPSCFIACKFACRVSCGEDTGVSSHASKGYFYHHTPQGQYCPWAPVWSLDFYLFHLFRKE